MLEEKHIKLVERSWTKVIPKQHLTAGIFYTKLFAIDPEIRTLFPESLDKQKRKLMATMNIIVNSLRSLDKLIPMIRKLGYRHLHYDVKEAHFYSIGGAFLSTLQTVLGEAYTDEVDEAWTIIYNYIGDMMNHAMNEKRLVLEALT